MNRFLSLGLICAGVLWVALPAHAQEFACPGVGQNNVCPPANDGFHRLVAVQYGSNTPHPLAFGETIVLGRYTSAAEYPFNGRLGACVDNQPLFLGDASFNPPWVALLGLNLIEDSFFCSDRADGTGAADNVRVVASGQTFYCGDPDFVDPIPMEGFGYNGYTLSLYTTAGSDIVQGGSGDDYICGGNSDDTIRAGSGVDMLFGMSGNDRLNGQSGGDLSFGGVGDDQLFDNGFDTNGDMLYGESGTGDCVNDPVAPYVVDCACTSSAAMCGGGTSATTGATHCTYSSGATCNSGWPS